jgi:hypothetical protein
VRTGDQDDISLNMDSSRVGSAPGGFALLPAKIRTLNFRATGA